MTDSSCCSLSTPEKLGIPRLGSARAGHTLTVARCRTPFSRGGDRRRLPTALEMCVGRLAPQTDLGDQSLQ